MSNPNLIETYAQALNHTDDTLLRGEKAQFAALAISSDIAAKPADRKNLIDVLVLEASNTYGYSENNYFESLQAHKEIEQKEQIRIKKEDIKFQVANQTLANTA